MRSPGRGPGHRAGILCIALAWTLCRPLLALDPDRSLAQLAHSRWTLADGLPGEVGALAQTPDGYLWIGAGQSLFRFDGVRFKPYRSADGATLSTVSSLLADPGGTLWVGLRAGGIVRIEAASEQRYGVSDGVPDGVVYGFAAEPDGTIWAATEEGLTRLRDGAWQPVGTADGFAGRHARAVFVDNRGAVWAASENRLYHRAAGSARFEDADITVGWVSQIAQDRRGIVWIAHRYNGGVRSTDRAEAIIAVDSTGITFDRHGSLWIGTLGSGLLRVPPGQTNRAAAGGDTLTAHQGLSADYVRCILEDREGNLWVGTSHGLDRIRDTPFVTAELPGGAHYFALAPGHDDSLWIGSINRPALQLDRSGVTELAMPPPVTAASTDRDGAIWLGGPNGIWRSSGDDLVPVADRPTGHRSEGAIRALVRDDTGTLWVSENDQGLFRRQNGAWFAVPPVSDDPSQIMPVTAAAGADGQLWFGYRNDLVVAWDTGSDSKRMWGPAQGVDVGHVTAIYAGTRLWIGGQHGLAVREGERFRTLPVAGAPLQGLYGIVETADRDVWLYALSGAHRIPQSELDRAIGNGAHPLRTTRFDDVPALPDDPTQVRPLPALVTTPDGRLWFATGSGVVSVNPSRLDAVPPAPDVTLEEIVADGQPLPAGTPALVPALTDRLRLHYSAPALGHPERVRFRFMLDGYDDHWQEAGERREAVYTRLPPGRYRFRVAAANQGGVWGAPGAVTEVIVRAAPHQTVVFRVLVAAALAALLWLGYRMRLRQLGQRLQLRLDERHRERERIARDLHDTLLQSVQGLLLKFHAATGYLAPTDPARAALLGVLDRAEEVLEEGRGLVQGLRRSEEPPGDLAESLLEAAQELADGEPPRVRVAIQGDPRPLEAIVHEELLHIGREALINALRHADAGHIEIELGYGRRTLHLRVRDDGVGMDAAHASHDGRSGHFGIPGMYERAAHIGATLELWSRPGSGTEVALQIPSSVAYRRRSDAGVRN